MWQCVLALVPIAAIFVLLLGLRKSAVFSGFVAWGLTIAIAFATPGFSS